MKGDNVFILLRKCHDLHTQTYFYLLSLKCGFVLIKFYDGKDIYSNVEKYDDPMFEKKVPGG